jgi:hypothetical protein
MANNLTSICEPIVWKMWEPLSLTTLWASIVCNKDNFTVPTLKYRYDDQFKIGQNVGTRQKQRRYDKWLQNIGRKS